MMHFYRRWWPGSCRYDERFKRFSGCSRASSVRGRSATCLKGAPAFAWAIKARSPICRPISAAKSTLGYRPSRSLRLARWPRIASHTVDFIRYLQQSRPGQKVLIFWDGVSYHHQHTMRDFLQTMQADVPPDEWKICGTRLAPYTPQENPVEDIWLKGKTFVRTHALWTTCFEQIKDHSRRTRR